jgi:hypothetical protein
MDEKPLIISAADLIMLAFGPYLLLMGLLIGAVGGIFFAFIILYSLKYIGIDEDISVFFLVWGGLTLAVVGSFYTVIAFLRDDTRFSFGYYRKLPILIKSLLRF